MIDRLRERFGDRLLFVFRHFPLFTVHRHASVAAQAAEAAGMQGQFWAMHDLLYRNQDRLDPPDLTHHALKLGLDVYRFEHDLGSGAYLKRVEADYKSGQASGVRGTPALFINGQRFSGEVELAALNRAIETVSDRRPRLTSPGIVRFDRGIQGDSMARTVTLFTGQWADLPLEELASKAKAFGYDGLELACWGDHFDVAKALTDKKYVRDKWDLLNDFQLTCHAISAHLVGQCICDNIDARHKSILPEEVWGNGDPEGVRKTRRQAPWPTPPRRRGSFAMRRRSRSISPLSSTDLRAAACGIRCTRFRRPARRIGRKGSTISPGASGRFSRSSISRM